MNAAKKSLELAKNITGSGKKLHLSKFEIIQYLQ